MKVAPPPELQPVLWTRDDAGRVMDSPFSKRRSFVVPYATLDPDSVMDPLTPIPCVVPVSASQFRAGQVA
jgi:hypothetical protein